jgi:hypothetical protein
MVFPEATERLCPRVLHDPYLTQRRAGGYMKGRCLRRCRCMLVLA